MIPTSVRSNRPFFSRSQTNWISMETTFDSRKGSGGESSHDSRRNDSYATTKESDGHNTTPPSATSVSSGSGPWPSSGHPPLSRPKTVQALDTSEEGHSSRYSSMFRRNESRASNPSVAAGPYSVVARRSKRQLRTPPSTGRKGSLEPKPVKREGFLSIDGNLGSSYITVRSDPGSGDCLSIYLSYHPQETPTTELEVRSATSNQHSRSEWERKSRGKEIESRGAGCRCSDWSRNREEWDNSCPDVDELGAKGACDKTSGPCNTSRSFYHKPFSVPFNVMNDSKSNELSERPSFFRDSPFARRLRSLVRGSGKCRQSEARRNRCRQPDDGRQRFASEVGVSCERCNARRATKTRLENEYILPDDQQNVRPPTNPHQNRGTANNLLRKAKHNESARYEDMKQAVHQSKTAANNLFLEANDDESSTYADMKQSTYNVSFPSQNEGDSFHRLASDDLYGPRLAPFNLGATFTTVPHRPAPEPKLPFPICKNQKSGIELINRKLFCRRKSQNRKGEVLDCRMKRGGDLANNGNSAQSSELELEATFQRRRGKGEDEYVSAWECGATLERRNEEELLTSGEMEREASGETKDGPKENWFGRRQEGVRCLGLSRTDDSLSPEDAYPGNWNDLERQPMEWQPIERPHIKRPPEELSLPGNKSKQRVAVSDLLKKSAKLYPEVDELVGEGPNVELPISYHGRRRLSSSLNEVIPVYEEIDHPRKGDDITFQRKKKTRMETGGKSDSLGRRFLNLMERLRRSVSKRKKSTEDGRRGYEL